jgi:hypothetical protein
MYFDDQHTHDDFEIQVEEWIVESPQEFGCKEYPVMWPGVDTQEGLREMDFFILKVENSVNYNCSFHS